MEKEGLSMLCRICLTKSVRMFAVNDRRMQEMYEALTGVPFVTEDGRPVTTCYLCYTKLKECCWWQRKCLQSEEVFAKMAGGGNYEEVLSNNRSVHLELAGFVQTPVELISIQDACHVDSVGEEMELPAVCGRLCHVEVKAEPISDEAGSENQVNSHLETKETLPQCSGSEDYNAIIKEIKIEVKEEDEEVFVKERRISATHNDHSYVKKRLKMSLDDGLTSQDDSEAADFANYYTAHKEIEKIKLQNVNRCKQNKQTKKASNLTNLLTDRPSTVSKCPNCHVILPISEPSTTNVSNFPPIHKPQLSKSTRNAPNLSESHLRIDSSHKNTVKVNYAQKIHQTVITLDVPNTQSNTQFMSLEGNEKLDSQDGRNQKEIEKKKFQNKIRCQKYRDRKKQKQQLVTLISTQTQTLTPEEVKKILLRKEYNKLKNNKTDFKKTKK